MIALFVIKLSAGITLMWLLMPRSEVTDGFFRIQMRLLLGTTVLTALLLSGTTTWAPVGSSVESGELPVPAEAQSAAEAAAVDAIRTADTANRTALWIQRMQIAAACTAYFGSIFWALGRRLPGKLSIYLLTLICCGSLTLHSWWIPHRSSLWLQLLSDTSSAAVLGATLTAMLLGHWYLTTPTMSIRPLSWFAAALFVAAGLRFLASVIVLSGFGFAGSDTTRWLWLSMRWCGGIIVPMIVSLLVVRILRYRNTQSATGVLFAGLILVFMGEMTAALLERDMLIPY